MTRSSRDWHGPLPKDDAWRSVTLGHIQGLGQRLWLRCNACGHDLVEEPGAFAAKTGLAMATPLLLIGRALCCSSCGARKAHCWPEPRACATSTR